MAFFCERTAVLVVHISITLDNNNASGAVLGAVAGPDGLYPNRPRGPGSPEVVSPCLFEPIFIPQLKKHVG